MSLTKCNRQFRGKRVEIPFFGSRKRINFWKDGKYTVHRVHNRKTPTHHTRITSAPRTLRTRTTWTQYGPQTFTGNACGTDGSMWNALMRARMRRFTSQSGNSHKNTSREPNNTITSPGNIPHAVSNKFKWWLTLASAKEVIMNPLSILATSLQSNEVWQCIKGNGDGQLPAICTSKNANNTRKPIWARIVNGRI